ncbi:hypothetical protein [Pacificibacter marinus]|uniref:Uncharacterized protein n=1 Tax=Pacificibacter marinus TaxID=658057 RepID=A0A1Y5TJW6_9RHOB|nr:hypothetical protein [Pacificibacter marinus]SEL38764.1 hypothetical protein SAMN04488032_1233 [Pacificibacter marinus]SLN65996.1 hypothetical protein PAM7971_03477 [Pacificibacter marinus]
MVDLKTQLKNVAFGGSWSEEILRVSELEAALSMIENAADTCIELDVRTDALNEALSFVASKIEKGPQLKAQFLKAVVIEDQDARSCAAQHVLRQMQSWAGR